MPIRSLTFDASRAYQKSRFGGTSAAESDFARSLRKIARAAAAIIEAHTHGAEIKNTPQMMAALDDYSIALKPWAERRSAQMVAQVGGNNRRAWQGLARSLGVGIRLELLEAPVGAIATMLVHQQTSLITSIPTDAATRAQYLAREAMIGGRRADEVAEELARTYQVTESHAMTIARTEVSRSNATLNQARAQSVGSQRYIWRTMGDRAVRESHRRMDGIVCEWAKAPTLSDGTTTHPGCIYNCRCYAEPILDGSVVT